jgi:hypothetical protein
MEIEGTVGMEMNAGMNLGPASGTIGVDPKVMVKVNEEAGQHQ